MKNRLPPQTKNKILILLYTYQSTNLLLGYLLDDEDADIILRLFSLFISNYYLSDVCILYFKAGRL